jgi:hypothetical protein
LIPFFIFHILFATIFAWLLCWVGGSLNIWFAVISLVLALWPALKSRRIFMPEQANWRLGAYSSGGSGLLELIAFVFVLYVSTRHFLWLLFPIEHNFATLSAFNYGDLPLHINYIRYLANGAAFPPLNPSFALETLRYPLGIDLYSALYETIGVPLRAHLFLVGIGATLTSLVLLRSYASWWAVIGFFLSGGLIGWGVLTGQPLTNISDHVEWKNLFLSVFLTQRGMLFAVPAALFLLIVYRGSCLAKYKLQGSKLFFFSLLWGVLPLFHLHVFVIVSLMLFGIRLECSGGSIKTALKNGLGFFISRPLLIAFVPAVLIIWHSTDGFQKASILHISWGWTSGQMDLFSFLLFNFGPWLMLPVAIAVALIFNRPRLEKSRRREFAIDFGVQILLLLFFFNVMLAPWDWDNIKILIWPYLALVRIAFLLFDDHLNSVNRPTLAAVLGLSGFMSLAWSIQAPAVRSVVLFGMGDVANVEGSLARVAKNSAVFAAAPVHNHPIAFLGCARVLGYVGHLWSHGINSSAVETQQENLMKGSADWAQLAASLQITHIYWGPLERAKYGEGDRPWRHKLNNVSRVPGYEVYEVRTTPTPSLSPPSPAPVEVNK